MPSAMVIFSIISFCLAIQGKPPTNHPSAVILNRNVREFLNYTDYTWTYDRTTPKTLCKVDHVVYGTYKEAMFYRNVSGLPREIY